MTDDQFWRFVITSAFVALLSMAMPRIRKWVDSLGAPSNGNGERAADGRPVRRDSVSDRPSDRGPIH